RRLDARSAPGVRPPPLLDALDDVEVLAGLDQAEPPRAAHERGAALDLREALLELVLPHLEPGHLRRPDLDGVVRVHVPPYGAVVEQREQDGDPESRPARPSPASPGAGHGVSLRRSRGPSYATSTLIRFVVPGMFTDVPAVITTRSPVSITPAS